MSHSPNRCASSSSFTPPPTPDGPLSILQNFVVEQDVATHLEKQEHEEAEQLRKFVAVYENVTGRRLDSHQKGERPDFICARSDGKRIGIELTEVPPKTLLEWHRIVDGDTVMDSVDLIEHIYAIVNKKEHLRSRGDWQHADEHVLVITLQSYQFDSLDWLADLDLQNEFIGTGFAEIWICDNTTLDAHGASQLIGLFPTENWGLHRPFDFDPKPFG